MSSYAIAVIGFLGGAVALAMTTLYPIANAREKQKVLAETAWKLLIPEVIENLNLLGKYKVMLSSDKVPDEEFGVGSWQAISSGGLLIGLAPGQINTALRVYRLINSVNALHYQLLDVNNKIGMTGSSFVPPSRYIMIRSLARKMDDLETELTALRELQIEDGN